MNCSRYNLCKYFPVSSIRAELSTPKHCCSSGLIKEAPRKIGDFPPFGLNIVLFDGLFVLISSPSVPSGFIPLFRQFSLYSATFLVHVHLQKCCETSMKFAAVTVLTPPLSAPYLFAPAALGQSPVCWFPSARHLGDRAFKPLKGSE